MPEPLQSFSSDDTDIPLFLARTWAEHTVRALDVSRAARRRFSTLDRAYERMDADYLTWADVQKAFSEAWAADCVLIVSASQFELWLTKLYEARDRPAPARLPLLRELRNAVVHLDEAVLDEESWTATAGTPMGERHGIGALPGSQLEIWLSGQDSVLNVIPGTDLETHVNTLLDELSGELDAYARDWFDMIRSGR